MPTNHGETLLERYQREQRIEDAITAKLQERTEHHANLHLYQIHLEAERARKHIKRLAEFPARSAGQKRRYQRIKQGESK